MLVDENVKAEVVHLTLESKNTHPDTQVDGKMVVESGNSLFTLFGNVIEMSKSVQGK